MTTCYGYFNDTSSPKPDRIIALRSLGYCLSMQSTAIVLDSLNSLLAPRLVHLQQTIVDTNNVDKDEVLFELNVVSTLIATIDAPKSSNINNGMQL